MERSSGAAPPRQSGGASEPESLGQQLPVTIESPAANASVVSLAGELDLSTIPMLEKRLLEQIRVKDAVIVDLTNVTFIDSSGIGLLIRAFRSCENAEPLMTVIAAGSQVERVFQLAGIDRALPLFMDRGRAMEALNGAVDD